MSYWKRPNVFKKRWGSYGSIRKPYYKQNYYNNYNNYYEEVDNFDEEEEIAEKEPLS